MCRFFYKFAAKWCKRFPPHLNNVSCETWNAHSYMLPLSCYRKKLQILLHLNCGLQIRQIWINFITAHVGNVVREGVQNTHHCSGAINDATDEWLPQWRHSPALGLIVPLCSVFSVAVSDRADQWHVFCTPSLAIALTHCKLSQLTNT